MVTGKRDLLSEEAREVIRDAGIFHIITISGVQMTLVSGIFFVGFRAPARAVSHASRCNYPIKKWAAALAMFSRLRLRRCSRARGSARSARCYMTLIMLGAVLVDRPALTMRNLALAALRGGDHRAGGLARRELSIVVRGGGRAGRGL